MNVNVWTLNGITIVAQESKDSYWVPALWACAPGGGWVFTSAGSHSSPLLFKAEEILQLTPDCTSCGSVVQLLVLAQCSSLPLLFCNSTSSLCRRPVSKSGRETSVARFPWERFSGLPFCLSHCLNTCDLAVLKKAGKLLFRAQRSSPTVRARPASNNIVKYLRCKWTNYTRKRNRHKPVCVCVFLNSSLVWVVITPWQMLLFSFNTVKVSLLVLRTDLPVGINEPPKRNQTAVPLTIKL